MQDWSFKPARQSKNQGMCTVLHIMTMTAQPYESSLHCGCLMFHNDCKCRNVCTFPFVVSCMCGQQLAQNVQKVLKLETRLERQGCRSEWADNIFGWKGELLQASEVMLHSLAEYTEAHVSFCCLVYKPSMLIFVTNNVMTKEK